MTDETTQPIEDDAEPEPVATCASCDDSIMDEDECHSIVTGRAGHRAVHSTWCQHCYENDSIYVSDIEENVSQHYAESYLYFWESDDEWHTEPDESESSDDMLYDYGTDIIRVHGWPRRTPQDALCFGVELEMESKRRDLFEDMVARLGGKDGNGRYILKTDGSLEDGQGAELVTLPYTLEDHRKVFRWDNILTPGLRSIAKSGLGTTSCGTNVHVNRAALSALTIGKLLVFLNSPANDSLVTCIAQRSSSSMCERDANKNKVSAVKNADCRYDILNISNYKTIEFRMFRGNLRPERVLKNIEFCHALIRYCESVSIQDAAERQGFLRYVEQNTKHYPNLAAFLVEKERISAPHARSTAEYAMLARKVAAEA